MSLRILLLAALLCGCGSDAEVAFRRIRMSDLNAPGKRILVTTNGASGEMALPAGTTVVFWDNASGATATVVVGGLSDDPTVAPATAGFVLDTDTSRAVAGPIPRGGFASLMFLAPGRYPYEVWLDGKAAGKGEVVVQ